MYAARLARRCAQRTGAQFFGMGGPRMAEAGVELIADYHEVAVVGIAEVLHKIPSVVAGAKSARCAKPCGARRRSRYWSILPGRTWASRARLKRHRHSGWLLHWSAGLGVAFRARTCRANGESERMVVIFPFEEKIYRDAGVPVDFVGHPLVGRREADYDPRGIRRASRT